MILFLKTWIVAEINEKVWEIWIHAFYMQELFGAHLHFYNLQWQIRARNLLLSESELFPFHSCFQTLIISQFPSTDWVVFVFLSTHFPLILFWVSLWKETPFTFKGSVQELDLPRLSALYNLNIPFHTKLHIF